MPYDMPAPRSSGGRSTMLDDVAGDLALWIDQTAESVALAFAPARAPFSANITEQQKLEFYKSRLFNPDGSPNDPGRTQELARLGAEGFARVYKAVTDHWPQLQPPEPAPIEVPEQWPGAPPAGPMGPVLPVGAPPVARPLPSGRLSPLAPGPGPGPRTPMPPVRAMASGGVVTEPTLALIGEAGPEAVVPLADYQYMQPNYNPPPPQPLPPNVSPWQTLIAQHAGEYANDPRFLRIAAAAARAESSDDPRAYQIGYDPNDPSTWQKFGGRGLWQFDVNPGALGHGVPEEQLLDPAYQASVIVPQFAANYGRLQSTPGLTEAQLAAQVYAAAERPAGTYGGRWQSTQNPAYQNYVRAWNSLAPGG